MGTSPVALAAEAAGSTSARFGVVEVAAAVGGELPEEDKGLIVGMVVAVGEVAVRRVLGWMSGALRAAAAVAVAVGRRSRRMPDRPEVGVMLLLGWSFAKYAMARSDAMIGGAAEAFESRAGVAAPRVAVAADTAVVGVEGGIAEWESACRKRPVLADCIETFCSYPGMAQDMVLVRDGLVGIQGSHLEIEEVVHSCQIGVHCQSSSFPCHPGDSSEQH